MSHLSFHFLTFPFLELSQRLTFITSGMELWMVSSDVITMKHIFSVEKYLPIDSILTPKEPLIYYVSRFRGEEGRRSASSLQGSLDSSYNFLHKGVKTCKKSSL